jgi:exonuclease SbcD
VRGRTDSEIMASFVTDMRSAPSASEIRLLERALASVQRDEVTADEATGQYELFGKSA